MPKNIEIQCKCGCGAKFLKYDNQGRSREYLRGHCRKNKALSEEHKSKIGKANKGNVCFRKGYGISTGAYVSKTGRRLRRIWNEFKEKNTWKCSECGNTYKGRYLHVHHVDGNNDNNEERNLVTLCCKCHNHLHTSIIMEQRKTA